MFNIDQNVEKSWQNVSANTYSSLSISKCAMLMECCRSVPITKGKTFQRLVVLLPPPVSNWHTQPPSYAAELLNKQRKKFLHSATRWQSSPLFLRVHFYKKNFSFKMARLWTLTGTGTDLEHLELQSVINKERDYCFAAYDFFFFRQPRYCYVLCNTD